MQVRPIRITIGGPVTFGGPITIETEISEEVLARFLALNPTSSVVKSSSLSATAHSGRNDKSWDDLEIAKKDLKQLYREVAEVGKKILVFIAQHGQEGCSFEDMKHALADQGDIQRRMNTVFQVARRLRYINKDNKGMPPWDTEYMNGKPFYKMNGELAAVLLDLSATR